MTKTAPKYTQSYIYKLCCNDPTITDIYIGSTTNMRLRKHGHKTNCTTPGSKMYKLNLYKFIRDNGGWENWCMVMIEQYACNTKHELLRRERYHIELLKPTLNTNIPSRTRNEYYEDNKQKINERTKQYYKDHKEELIQWRRNHQEQNTIHKRLARIKNTFMKDKYMCDCGYLYRYDHKPRHLRSKQHIKSMINPFIKLTL